MSLHWNDQKADELRARFPAWRIWYVPLSTGGATWCAQPLPVINVNSADELAAAIEAAGVVVATRLSEGLETSGGISG
jgi:hypothetical protein